MSSRIITQSLKFILVLMLISGLFGIVYSQNAKLTVPSDVRTETMILNPQNPAFTPPCACAPNEEGRIFYNDNDNKLYYCDGANWKVLNPEKTVATKIVSAYNSSGATRADGTACVGDGTTCNNPKADYTCDGTDDQEKINQTINDLPSVGGTSYGVVYLLEGTYNISATALPSPQETLSGIVLHSNTAIIGTGRGTVLKVVVSANFNVINASSVSRILISQLMIDGNRPNLTGLNHGIYFKSVTFSKIDKVWSENMRRLGIYLSSSSNNTISNNHVQGNNEGIQLDSSSNNIISHNNVQGSLGGTGIYLLTISSPSSFCNNNIISNNNVQGNSGYGIRLEYNVDYLRNNIISNNNVQGNGLYGIDLHGGCENNIISNNNVQGNHGYGIPLFSGSSNNIISNNNVQGNGYEGIHLYASSRNTVTGNVIYDNGGSFYQDGINLLDSDTNIISSNRISDSAGTGYGIDISSNACDDNYLVGNLIDGAGYAGRLIQDLGTGTKYTDKAKLTSERKQVDISTSPYNLDVATNPQGYVALNPTGPSYSIGNITDGKSGGDLLILENINATNTITIPNGDSANTRLSIGGVPSSIQLYQNDTLSLIWNGNGTAGVGDWVEIGYSDNSP